MNKQEVDLQMQILAKAIHKLNDAVEHFDQSEIQRDGIIQRFEFSIELSWKTLKKILKFIGEDDKLFAKELFKKFDEYAIIHNIEIWIDFMDIRNRLSHIYSEETAIESFNYIKENYSVFSELFN
jgi:nucleotidyltransferase substrate binding protein (TIGR01987 family)